MKLIDHQGQSLMIRQCDLQALKKQDCIRGEISEGKPLRLRRGFTCYFDAANQLVIEDTRCLKYRGKTINLHASIQREIGIVTCLNCFRDFGENEVENSKQTDYQNLCESCFRFLRVKQSREKRRISVAQRIQATPSWADKDKIRAIYNEARRLSLQTGIPHHVDHIIPICSPVVCGLNVHDNLQVITAQENLKKSNHFI